MMSKEWANEFRRVVVRSAGILRKLNPDLSQDKAYILARGIVKQHWKWYKSQIKANRDPFPKIEEQHEKTVDREESVMITSKGNQNDNN